MLIDTVNKHTQKKPPKTLGNNISLYLYLNSKTLFDVLKK